MPSGVSACDLREEVFLVLYLKDISAGEEKCKTRFKKHFLDNLIAMHIDRAVIVVGKYENDIRAALGSRYSHMALSYARQEIPAGCIHALFSALPYWNGETVVLQLSDEIYIRFHADAVTQNADADFLCGYTATNNMEAVRDNYAVYCKEQSNQMIRCEEKPKVVQTNKKGTGFCVFDLAYHEEAFREQLLRDVEEMKSNFAAGVYVMAYFFSCLWAYC